MFPSPVGFPNETSSTIQALQSYPNIHFLNINIELFVAGTEAEEFYSSRKLFKSKYLVNNVSNLLRILVLHVYGGIYFDLDVIVQRNLDELTGNFCGKETKVSINQAVIGLERYGELSTEFLVNYVKDFQPNIWAFNGPMLWTRVLRRQCGMTVDQMTINNCDGVKIYPASEFYPIDVDNARAFFNLKYTDFVLAATNKSMLVHFWNSHTKIYGLLRMRNKKSNSKTAFEIIAERNCPRIFGMSKEKF